MTGAFIKRGNLDTDMYTESEDEGRDWEDAFIRQGTLKIVGKPVESRRKAWNGLSLMTPRRDQHF